MTTPKSKLLEALRFEAHAAAVFAALKYQRHPGGDETKTCDEKFVEWFMHHARLRGGWCHISQLHDSWHVGWGLPCGGQDQEMCATLEKFLLVR